MCLQLGESMLPLKEAHNGGVGLDARGVMVSEYVGKSLKSEL